MDFDENFEGILRLQKYCRWLFFPLLCTSIACRPPTAMLEYDAPQHLTFMAAPIPPLLPNAHILHTENIITTSIPLDLWERTRQGFQLSYNEMHPDIQWHIQQYQRNPQHIQTLAQRAKPYFYLIIEAIEKRDLPMELAYLPMVESALDPFIDSHGHAAGIWQIVPGTADLLGLQRDFWYDGRRDILASTEAALSYLTYLNARFKNDWLLALAAYNSGEGTVARAIRKNHSAKKIVHFYHLDLPKETQDYVPKLLALISIVRQPERYGFTLPLIENRPQLTTVNIEKQIDLMLASKLADISIAELYRLNPGYHQWATHPNGPHQLLLPIDNAITFKEKIAKVDPKNLAHWQMYELQNGETLQTLAKQTHTTIESLCIANKLLTTDITNYQTILLPIPLKSEGRSPALFKKCIPPACQNMHLTHFVKPGETLHSIAKKYQIAPEDISQWNALTPTDALHERKSIVIRKPERNQAVT